MTVVTDGICHSVPTVIGQDSLWQSPINNFLALNAVHLETNAELLSLAADTLQVQLDEDID